MHPPSLPNNENHGPPSSTQRNPSKMFSLPEPQSSPFSLQSSNYYTPSKPSPLSSSPLRANRSPLTDRHENADYSFTMSSPPPPPFSSAQSSAHSSAKPSTGKKIVKKNPLTHREDKDSGRETRRKLFLKRVREDSENKRWDKKGGDDELLRSIYLADHKRNIGRNIRYDAAYDETPEDIHFGDEAPSLSQQPVVLLQPSISQPLPRSLEEEQADEVARQEEAELQAYLEMCEAEHDTYQEQQSEIPGPQLQVQTHWQIPMQGDQEQQQQQQVAHVQRSASDDVDYDGMFEDMNMHMDGAGDIGEHNASEQQQQQGQRESGGLRYEDMMDMS